MSTSSLHPFGITLVIPTYNRGALIAATIDSALNQQHPFEQIIVVDDGSTDNTANVLAEFGDRITVLNVPNGGVQQARNAGVRAAASDWVALCDSDDLLLPSYSATLTQHLRMDPACDAIYCNFIPFTESRDQADKFSGAPVGFFDGARRSGDMWQDIPDLYERTVIFQPLFPSGSVIRKSLYEAIGGYDARFNRVGAEDWEFTLRLIAAGRLALCAVPLVRIRKHDSNDSIDNLRQNSGCIQILEYALQHHPVAKRYNETILRSIDARRLAVFDEAFARGDFNLAAQTLALVRERPRHLRFRIKAFINGLPASVRHPVWRSTQAR